MRKQSPKRKKKYWTEGGRGLQPILEQKTEKEKQDEKEEEEDTIRSSSNSKVSI
jgi:hypothetical protein